MAEQGNPFVQGFNIPGQGSSFLPTPLFTPQGGFATGITSAAKEFAKESQNSAMDFLGKRGLTDSSFAPVALNRAFRGGFRDATNLFQQQQGVFGNLAGQHMNMVANQPGESALGNFFSDPIGTVGNSLFGANTAIGGLLGSGSNKFLGLF